MLRHILTFAEFFQDGYPVEENDTLYIILDGDKCRKDQHDLHNVPLSIKYPDHTEKAPGQYCRTCRQAQINRNIYAKLKSQHGDPCCKSFVKGLEDVVFEEPKPNFLDYTGTEYKERANESKLRKLGYSVSAISGLSDRQRQVLLQNAIECGAISRGYVISYLSNMIKINGRSPANAEATKKWQSDLDFVLRLK